MELRPLPPLDRADEVRPHHDKADDGYSLPALEQLLSDCDEQPRWRDEADLCCAYYDGDQLTPQQIHEARKNGLEPRAYNLIGRTINGVLGQEAKARRDPTLQADDDDGADVADVLNVKLKEAQRETCADMAISNAYKGQVLPGIGWVEVSRVADPLEYQYRVEDVHRSEIWWDWRAKKIDLSDARWLCRRQWKDLDAVVAAFPEHRAVLENAVGNWATWLFDDLTDERRIGTAFNADRAFKVSRNEWVDGGRKRLRMYEVWYRVPAQVIVARVGQRWVPIDQKNAAHMEAVRRGMVPAKKAASMQVRRAIFAGPFRLIDEATTRRRFPYVPFFAFRRDGDNAPYGLVHGMIAPQDEFNETRSRIQWMRKAQQLIVESDALDPAYNTIADIAENMMRPDMVAVLNHNRTNKTGTALQFRNDMSLQREHFEAMQDSKGLIQDIPGIYSAQLGNAPTGVTSGLAINSLVEQGIVAMGELNDNYAFARRMVYDQLVDLIIEDHLEQGLQVPIGTGDTRRIVVLNEWVPEEQRMRNSVKQAGVTLGLGEAPNSPAYQMQMSQMMGDMVRALAATPFVGPLIPAWVESTPAFGPARKALADDMRRLGNLPTAGDRQGAQEWQAQQKQAAVQQQQAQQAAAAAAAQAQQAKAALDAAKAELTQAQTLETLVRADQAANEPDEQQRIADALAEADAPQAA